MIMNAFDAECEFVIEMNGAKVTKQVVNIYKSLGEDKVQQVFIDDMKDLIRNHFSDMNVITYKAGSPYKVV